MVPLILAFFLLFAPKERPSLEFTVSPRVAFVGQVFLFQIRVQPNELNRSLTWGYIRCAYRPDGEESDAACNPDSTETTVYQKEEPLNPTDLPTRFYRFKLPFGAYRAWATVEDVYKQKRTIRLSFRVLESML